MYNDLNDPKFYNRDGSLTRYSFACGYLQRVAFLDDGTMVEKGKKPFTDNMVDLSAANMEIALYDIKATLDGEYIWLQREGLKEARKCWADAKAIVKKFMNKKLGRDEALKMLNGMNIWKKF